MGAAVSVRPATRARGTPACRPSSSRLALECISPVITSSGQVKRPRTRFGPRAVLPLLERQLVADEAPVQRPRTAACWCGYRSKRPSGRETRRLNLGAPSVPPTDTVASRRPSNGRSPDEQRDGGEVPTTAAEGAPQRIVRGRQVGIARGDHLAVTCVPSACSARGSPAVRLLREQVERRRRAAPARCGTCCADVERRVVDQQRHLPPTSPARVPGPSQPAACQPAVELPPAEQRTQQGAAAASPARCNHAPGRGAGGRSPRHTTEPAVCRQIGATRSSAGLALDRRRLQQ